MKRKSYISKVNKIAYLNELCQIGVQAFAKRYPKISRQNCHVEALADFAMSQLVLAEETACSCCGATDNLQNGHLFTREWRAIRWDRRNCAAQCAGCNLKHEHNPEPYRRVMVMRLGEDGLCELYEKGVAGSDFSKLDKLEVALERWAEYKNFSAHNGPTIIGRRSE